MQVGTEKNPATTLYSNTKKKKFWAKKMKKGEYVLQQDFASAYNVGISNSFNH